MMIKKVLIIFFSVIILISPIICLPELHFGVISSVKKKSNELKEKLRNQPTAIINHPPVITSLTANPTSVSTSSVSTITCIATDPDGDTLITDPPYPAKTLSQQ